MERKQCGKSAGEVRAMSGEIKPVLIDTDVFVNHFRGQAPDTLFLKRVMVEEEFRGMYSAVTEVELFAAEKVSQAHADDIETILSNLQRIDLNSPIAKLAGELMGKFRKSHGLEMPDAIIASSALVCGAALITRNTRHYAFIPGLLLTSPDVFAGSE
jgi:predicted nucleic acid-binding protein